MKLPMRVVHVRHNRNTRSFPKKVMTYKRRVGYCLTLVILLVISCLGLFRLIFPPVHYDCDTIIDDSDGYLLAICQYLNENNIRIGPEFNFRVKAVREGKYLGRGVYIVILDCCRTGDIAFIDKETGQVLGYQKGAW